MKFEELPSAECYMDETVCKYGEWGRIHDSFDSTCKAIELAKVDAFNMGLIVAAQNCVTELTGTCIRVDKQSILKNIIK